MQAAASQIIRVRRGDDAVPQPVSQHCDAGAHGSSQAYAYYFLMPQVRTRRGARVSDLRMLVAFGPFRYPHEARFIGTSALFLGLVEDLAASAQYLHIDESHPEVVATANAGRCKLRIPETRSRMPLAALQATPSFHT